MVASMMTPVDNKQLILVVDDHKDILMSIERTIRNPSYRIVSKTDPLEAVQVLEQQAVDVVISDVDMPDMNGHEVMAEARRVRPTAVRILLTGGATLESALRAINEGEVHRYIRKPFDAKQLRQVVAQGIQRKEELARASEAGHRVYSREKLLAQLEAEHPGITKVARDDAGAYVFDAEHSKRMASALGLAPLL